ncbi:MAG: glycogen debranching protein [Ruminococcus sp.]|jgi:glycogen operon protein|nr:glycogen debranching protein [Ruminococcus sp.]
MKKVEGYPQPLGVATQQDKVNFAVSVPAGKKCELLLYRAGKTEPAYVYDMPEEEGLGEIRFLAVKGLDGHKYEYNFQIDDKVILDPYARELARTKKFGATPDVGLHEVRGRFSVSDYDWEGDRILKLPYHEVIAYSLHVRGFTKHGSSKVKHKGTFAGIVEMLPYLQELGINQIQCMPVYEFEELNEGRVNYWGYGRGYYFAPKAAYSAKGHAAEELKDMVKACHKSGIEVALEMPFTPDVPLQTVIECLKYYMLEYHIDGFIVNPYNVSWDDLKQDPLLKGAKIMQRDDHFQNTMRRFLKGDEDMVNSVIGALRLNTNKNGKCNYITGHTGFTLFDLVSYEAKHNEANGERNQDGPNYNYSWNCGAEGPSRKRAITELRKKQVRNAFLLLLTAQGTPCILAGDEFWNTQKGNNNVYCQDNDTSWLDWNKLKRDDSLFQYVKELIAFRKAHPSLHQKSPLLGLDRDACGLPDVSYHGENAWQIPSEVYSRQLGVLYCQGKEQEDICFIAYNMHWLKHSFALPVLQKNKKWYKVIGTGQDVVLKSIQHNEEMDVVKEPVNKAAEKPAKGKGTEDPVEQTVLKGFKDLAGSTDDEQRRINLDARSIVILVGR